MLLRSTTIPACTESAPPISPDPPPYGTIGVFSRLANRTTARTSETERGVTTQSGGHTTGLLSGWILDSPSASQEIASSNAGSADTRSAPNNARSPSITCCGLMELFRCNMTQQPLNYNAKRGYRKAGTRC